MLCPAGSPLSKLFSNAMKLGIWSLILIPLLIRLDQATPQEGKARSLKITIYGGNAAPITIHLPKQLRRKYIVKCCGFKKCLPPKVNATTKITSTTTPKRKSEPATVTTIRATVSTGSEPDESKIIDVSTLPAPEQTSSRSTVGGTEKEKSIIATAGSPTDSPPPPPPADTTAEAKTNASPDKSEEPTMASSSAVASTEIEAVTSTTTTTTTAKTSTSTSTTTTTATTTTTTTTTTTPTPCSLSCSNFNTFLKDTPTSKPSPNEGSMQSSNCRLEYFVSTINVTRNEAALRCKALNMTLLTVTSLEGLRCISNFKAGTYWTSGSNEDLNCDSEKKYAWCSTGFALSSALLALNEFWLPTNTTPTALDRCLAVAISSTPRRGVEHRGCDQTLPFICQYNVDCPKLCVKNDSLFDSVGNLMSIGQNQVQSINSNVSLFFSDKAAYGIWYNIGNLTYLLGNKPVTWAGNYQQCCALGMEALNIDNAAEQTGLKRFTIVNIANWSANFNYWTSGTWKGAPVGKWAWCEPNGPTVFTQDLDWEDRQPDNKGGNESCVHFRFVLNYTGTVLTDRNCSNKYIFTCKGQLSTTSKPCVAPCPQTTCTRDYSLFNTEQILYNYFSYGNWYDACGRNFLIYRKNMSTWETARTHCCRVGLTLASMESTGKANCFSKIVSKFAPVTFGDFWLSGTDLDCDSNFRWCSMNRAFEETELRWKGGHPVKGLDCVYLEVRNESLLLATADCAEKKDFLCEVRKKATSQKAMQTECAEIWNITSEQIDLLLNASAFLATSFSLDLKCFLKCIGVEVGLFDIGSGLNSIKMLREIELVSQEEPTRLQQGFVAHDECSGKKLDDECVTAYETFKCGQEKEPALLSKIVQNNFGNSTIFKPPTPCVPPPRTCWISNAYPCVKNQTATDLINKTRYDGNGTLMTNNNMTVYVSNMVASLNPIDAYKHCCSIGMKMLEPETRAESNFIMSTFSSNHYALVGETEFINQSHEVWCQSRKVLPDNMYYDLQSRYPCAPSILTADHFSRGFMSVTMAGSDIVDYFLYPEKYNFTYTGLNKFLCVET